jgi:hypothetical protein
MSLAEHQPSEPRLARGDTPSSIPAEQRSFARAPRTPGSALPMMRSPKMEVYIDRVRAKPALSPQLSMNLGATAIALGVWGTLFPNHVKRTLGINASTGTVRALFGARELATGWLAADPTKAGILWARVGGDIFDIAVLRSLDNESNPQRKNVKGALAFVYFAIAMDALAAVRMTNVKRNCI